MLWLKGCPRCGMGDLVVGRDLYGLYRSCVQCGYCEDLPSAEVLAPAPALVMAGEPRPDGAR